MKYFIIPDSLARELGLTNYRRGNVVDGWLVNQGDLATVGTDVALQQGAIAINEREARDFINSLNKK